VRASGETGRRAGLRIQWGNPWEFKSPLAHQPSTDEDLVGISRARVDLVLGALCRFLCGFVQVAPTETSTDTR
jgi:hypothetical protein